MRAAPVVVGPGRAVRRADDHESRAVRRPLEGVHPARQVGQPARLAAVERQEVDLVRVLAGSDRAPPVAAARATMVLGGRVLLDVGPPVRDEGERPPVRGVARMVVVLRAEGHLAGGRSAVGVDLPERVAIAVEAGRDGLDDEGRAAAVGRQARFGRDSQAVQVVGARRTRHGGPPEDGTLPV